MYFFGKLVVAALLLSLQSSAPAPAPPAPAVGYRLVFNEEFDNFDLSSDGRGFHTWYEGVWFSHKHAPLSNIKASSSALQLDWTADQEQPDTSITTDSHDKRHIKPWLYGYFEQRMKWVPEIVAWPAF